MHAASAPLPRHPTGALADHFRPEAPPGVRGGRFARHARAHFASLLRRADVELDGAAPWDPRVHDDRLFARVLVDGTLGLGEAYVDGWWDCPRLDELVARVARAGVAAARWSWRDVLAVAEARIWNAGRRSRAFDIATHHYDLGNDLFEAMLDRRLTYSCAYWKDARDLDEAQEAKLDLICRKIGLRPGMRVLDIGSGWGSFAIFAAERYGARVVGLTVSQAQQRLATERGRHLPVEFRVQDYRDVDEPFDAVVSIGMFEHVGPKNYGTYFDVVRRCLRPDGLSLLHTIGSRAPSAAGDGWIMRYIFPGAHLPSAHELTRALGRTFVIEDWHNFGADYDRTLLAWDTNFRAGWDRLRVRYDQRFYRLWRYYLLTCAGKFRARQNQLWQIVLAKNGVTGGYASLR
ncbi:MAG TPA: cyclopropane fatty acyl phospholipid synthase [Candidatus Eisenbacteria bacterium]|nr:cyclopropane fatty acyl phospholipid synthase [Candidatus Eisenbacteria bacterium]